MTYEAWRCTFQSAEAAARAAYGQVQGAVAEAAGLREKLEARCPGLVQIQEPAPQSKVLAAILAARGALQHLKEGGKHSESLFKEALQAIDSVVAPIESTQAASAPVVLPEPTYQISQPFPSDPANTWRDASSKAYDLSLPSKCRIVYTEQQVRTLLAATCSLMQEVYDEFIKNGHDGGEFEDGEHPLADRVRAFLAGAAAPAAPTPPAYWLEHHSKSLIPHAEHAAEVAHAEGMRLQHLISNRTALYTHPAAQGVPAPVLYVSKEQLNNHRDHADSEAGRYLPCRITPAGKFTTPLYAAPQAQAEDARDAANEWEAINSLPYSDDLVWLYCQDTNTIDGPVTPSPCYVDSWTHWAYANAPNTNAIDAAIAAQAAKGVA